MNYFHERDQKQRRSGRGRGRSRGSGRGRGRRGRHYQQPYYKNNNNNYYQYNEQSQINTYYHQPQHQPQQASNVNNYHHNYNQNNTHNYQYDDQNPQYQNNQNQQIHSNNFVYQRTQTSLNQVMSELKIDDSQNTQRIGQVIATFNTSTILQPNHQSSKTHMNLKRVTYYHTAPRNDVLECNSKIQPTCIAPQSIKSLINMNFNKDIQIDYSTEKTQNPKLFSLSQHLPPDRTFRIDPFCHEIQKILKINAPIKSNVDDANKGARFITYRHNLRAIANIALFKLIKMRLYLKCGVNIGIWRNGNDIMLENIGELDDKPADAKIFPNFMYGFLLEHVLESLSNNKQMKPMKYATSTGLQRDEIRALNKIQIDDIVILSAAEMDGIMNNKVIELKCCKIQSKQYWRNQSKLPDIANFKLLKFWTQCKFGGVDSVVIAFHEQGIIRKTKILTTKEIEEMFPVITSKCIEIVHDTLKWVKDIVMKLPQYNLYLLSFDTNNFRNTKFVLKNLSGKETEKAVFDMLSNKGKNAAKHGLIINHNKQIELRTILYDKVKVHFKWVQKKQIN